eukprot:NODE_1142_length_989_cov_61.000000_g1097_i0.p1 GENE.NODE_1142_length_989_cov_61.000000_g1097_i0~~NODE_1142_length_989_cov_61.000000_g1097_i0.p1  ORF type:complete len:274 (-),score=60.60 NODE_1142_length_989_cov_61.000000_g1097_i0:58-879(-)
MAAGSMAGMRLALRELKKVNEESGGSYSGKEVVTDPAAMAQAAGVDLNSMDPYDKEQFLLAAQMKVIRDLIGERDQGWVGQTKAQQHASNQKIRNMTKEMTSRFNGLQKVAEKTNRQADYKQLQQHYKRTYDAARNRPETERIATGGRGQNVSEMKDMSRGFISVTDDDEFQAFFEGVRRKDEQMDKLLDVVSEGLTQLKYTGLQIRDELKTQDKILTDIETHVDNITEEIESMNKRMKQVLEKVKGENCFMYVLCIMLLLAIAAGGYAIFKT